MTKKCTCCGRVVTWETLKLVGSQDNGLGGTLQLRNCKCGTTLAVHVAGPRETGAPPSSRDTQVAVAE